jgi:hypothetical protein
MPKKKKKPVRKTKKKSTRPTKRTSGKAPARKKKLVRKKSRIGGVLAVEVTEVEIVRGVADDSVDEVESHVVDPLDEHFPPDYGGSE